MEGRYGPVEIGWGNTFVIELSLVPWSARRQTLSSYGIPAALLRHQGDRAAPAGAGVLDLHGQAGDVEAVRPRQLVEVGQLLDLAILARDAGEVGGPDETAIARAAVIGDHRAERPV